VRCPGPGIIRLAPLYDTVPTVLWPSLRTEAGMFVEGVRDLRRVSADNLVNEAVARGLGRRAAAARVHQTLRRLLDTLSRGLVDVDTPALATTAARIESPLTTS